MVNPGDEIYKTRDQMVVLLMLARGHTIVGTDRDNGIITFKFPKASVEGDINLWKSNQPIPLADGRTFVWAMEIFKTYIHGGV